MNTPFFSRTSVVRTGCALVFGLAVTGAADVRFGAHAPQPEPGLVTAPDGEEIYMMRCLACHQANGEGMAGVFPTLVGSEWVTGEKAPLIGIILHGVMGEMEVKGVTYSGMMPPWGSYLSDEEVAALLTYIRTSWGNEASEVTAEEVTQVREATAERKAPWTAEELEALEVEVGTE